jgi:DNA-binding MarR family transcriptional regulator
MWRVTPTGRLVDALVQASFHTTAVLSRVAAAHDLSLSQLRVLAILRDRKLPMSALADHLGLERSTVSGLIDRAEKRGLVRRTPSPVDGRGSEVSLTSAGRKLAAEGAAQVADDLAPLTDPLTASESQRLTTLLERLLSPTS